MSLGLSFQLPVPASGGAIRGYDRFPMCPELTGKPAFVLPDVKEVGHGMT